MWGDKMKALISPNEKVYSYTGALLGERVAEVTNAPFEVALPFHWVACADEVQADIWCFDPASTQMLQVPLAPPAPAPVKSTTEPVVI